MGFKLLASNFGVKWFYNSATDTHIMVDTLRKTETNLGNNPILACNIYYTRVDIVARQRIGKSLEKQGKNRYTGETLKGGNNE